MTAVISAAERLRQGNAVELDGVSKVHGSGRATVQALDGITLSVAQGEFVCVLGASGCGKSTLLDLLAGLEAPSSGTLRLGSATALMFQDSALFPWLTAARNVDLALKLRGVPRAQRPAKVAELLELVRLSDFADKRPHELSGGMRQRVALARALGQDAPILLMDEPFGALDAMTRDVLHTELERVWRITGRTIVFVTHNVREAVRLGDRVVLLTSRPGRVLAEFEVGLPRPRHLDDVEVATLAGAITERLRGEGHGHGRAG